MLVPFQRMTLHSASTPEVVGARLAKMVAAGGFQKKRPSEPFVGSIVGTHFEIERVLGTLFGVPARNSFQPVIIGDIARVANGTEIQVRMRLQLLVAALVAIWFGALFFEAAPLVWSGIRDGSWPVSLEGLRPYGVMVVFGYVLMSVAFWTDVKKARLLLAEGLGCRESQPQKRLVR
jgi:hypothetical protein